MTIGSFFPIIHEHTVNTDGLNLHVLFAINCTAYTIMSKMPKNGHAIKASICVKEMSHQFEAAKVHGMVNRLGSGDLPLAVFYFFSCPVAFESG
jgi:hypothetical protein